MIEILMMIYKTVKDTEEEDNQKNWTFASSPQVQQGTVLIMECC